MAIPDSPISGRDLYGGRTAHERREERSRRIREAAFELYGTRGYSATSVAEIAAAAHVSLRGFYEHTAGPENLFIEIVDDLLVQAESAVIETLHRMHDQPALARARAGLRAFVATTCRDRRTARLCFVESMKVSGAVDEWRDGRRQHLAAFVHAEADRGVANGEFRRDDYRLGTLALIGVINSLGYQLALADDGPDVDDICRELDRLLQSALAPESSAITG
ncbi:TetR/AcrR family transcriptional regulator [Nocardia terpenica]|nr:TetR/AcrR family transcriptional regulator [Nocardia terpenica]